MYKDQPVGLAEIFQICIVMEIWLVDTDIQYLHVDFYGIAMGKYNKICSFPINLVGRREVA